MCLVAKIAIYRVHYGNGSPQRARYSNFTVHGKTKVPLGLNILYSRTWQENENLMFHFLASVQLDFTQQLSTSHKLPLVFISGYVNAWNVFYLLIIPGLRSCPRSRVGFTLVGAVPWKATCQSVSALCSAAVLVFLWK
jgi:hypothetical protein